jgi:hypothetical protein
MSGYQLSVSATRRQHWFPDMFCNFYLVKSHKIANNSPTTEARERISTYFESFELKNFDVCSTKFENYQILLNKISHKFLVTTKLFSEWKSLIQQRALALIIEGATEKIL